MKHRTLLLASIVLTPSLTHALTVFAGEWPSLFRGVVVTDSPVGVRVVSVDESSPASLADLRPEDVIVHVQQTAIRSIDEFARLSWQLKGRVKETTVVVFRNGAPRQLHLHLYSDPLLQQWGVSFVPDDDLRFAQPSAGLGYWSRLGRAYEQVGKPEDARTAYLNALHQMSDQDDIALKVVTVSLQVSQRRLHEGDIAEGITRLREAVVMMQHLFERPLATPQLETVRQQLRATLEVLRAARINVPQGRPAAQ